MVPYWISSILDEEFVQMSYEIPSVMITNDELISINRVVSDEWPPINRVVNCEFTHNNVIASDRYIANDAIASDEYIANNVTAGDEYIINNVVTNYEYIPNNVTARTAYITNNTLTRNQYNISNNVLVSNEYISNSALAGVEYIPNNDLAIDEFLPNNVTARGEPLIKKEIKHVDEIPYCGIASDGMLPTNGIMGDQPGAMVAGDALPNIASDAGPRGDSDDDLLREYDVDQCERVAGDNNNQAARACGGCEPREHLEPCAGCPTCGPQDPEDDCNGCPRNLDACTNCGREPCAGCGPRNECNGCGNEPCDGCGPRGPNSAPEHCAGCGRRIRDRFFLQAVERRWHAPCLRCCECHLQLDSELTCFARDGNIFCKKDYYRLFGPKRCSRCQASISSSELVMRARDLVFHVHCFCCALCNTPLTKGDTFGMRDSTIYCRLHYEAMTECVRVPRAPPDMIGAPFFNGAAAGAPAPAPTPAPGAPRQKGRPRKRKPKDLEAMTANLDLNTEYLDMGFSRSGSGLGGSSRTKRMRTSFKHHQLRTMKSYFAINHNPDAKDLKQLSQKTGLPKRVLQVWFQNARAKWRRMMTKQEGKACSDKMSPEGGLELEGLYGAGGGAGLRLPPLSPPLDCP